jgi:hypothetical protein
MAARLLGYHLPYFLKKEYSYSIELLCLPVIINSKFKEFIMARNRKYLDADIIEAVKSNVSCQGVMRSLGIKYLSGGMHSLIKNRIKSLGVSTAHFLGSRANQGPRHKGGNVRLNASQILVKNRNVKFGREHVYLLQRALNEVGIKMVCNSCGLDSVWNNKEIVLEINHKNGNFYDNRVENLEYLCPNCHSQVPKERRS